MWARGDISEVDSGGSTRACVPGAVGEEGGVSGAASPSRPAEPLPRPKTCAWPPACLCALAPLCPCSAGPVPEPSFALCLDVLAPYLNQVNLIRAGVPKIVSRLPSAAFPGQRLRWAAALFSGTS